MLLYGKFNQDVAITLCTQRVDVDETCTYPIQNVLVIIIIIIIIKKTLLV